MPRPVKWSRDLHPIRERACRARTETWGRLDIEQLFGIGRASAQTLMKAIGEVQTVGGAHFVERPTLVAFLDEMITATSVEDALRARLLGAEPPPKPKSLRVSLPPDLRRAMLPDLPPNVVISPGRIEIKSPTAVGMLENLVLLAMVLQNDLERVRELIEPTVVPTAEDQELQQLLGRLREDRAQSLL